MFNKYSEGVIFYVSVHLYLERICIFSLFSYSLQPTEMLRVVHYLPSSKTTVRAPVPDFKGAKARMSEGDCSAKI